MDNEYLLSQLVEIAQMAANNLKEENERLKKENSKLLEIITNLSKKQ